LQGCRRLGEGREPLFDSYHEALVYWANRFGAMSVDVEFGAYIFRATPETSPPVYFMGETYKGGEFLRRDTVANGLIMGLVTGIAVSVFSRLPFNKLSTSDSKKERVTISIIGFAHTHPVGIGQGVTHRRRIGE